MRVVAFISDYQTSKRILKHIGEETVSFRCAQCKHCLRVFFSRFTRTLMPLVLLES